MFRVSPFASLNYMCTYFFVICILYSGAGERGVQGSGEETCGKETIRETQTQMGG